MFVDFLGHLSVHKAKAYSVIVFSSSVVLQCVRHLCDSEISKDAVGNANIINSMRTWHAI